MENIVYLNSDTAIAALLLSGAVIEAILAYFCQIYLLYF